MEYGMVYPLKERQQRSQTQSPEKFSYPGENFIKLNIDKASKGNLGRQALEVSLETVKDALDGCMWTGEA